MWTFKNGWLKPVLNFIGLAISTWGPVLNLPKRGDLGINRLDKIAKQHDIDYSHAKNLQDKWKADTKMIKAIDRLPGKKTMTERVVKKNHARRETFEIVKLTKTEVFYCKTSTQTILYTSCYEVIAENCRVAKYKTLSAP